MDQFGWKDRHIIIDTTKIFGVTNLDHVESEEAEVYYAAGGDPQGILTGNRAVKGSITLLQSAIIALEDATPTKNILDVRVNIIDNYVKAGLIRTDVLENVKFLEVPKGMKQGDFKSEHVIPFIAIKRVNGV